MNKLIQQLQSIGLDQEFLLKKGLTKIDISKPIAIKDFLLRKTERSVGYAGGDNLPFESFDHVDGIDLYAYKTTYTTLGILLFELLFSTEKYIEIQVSQAQSQIQQFFVYLDRENRHHLHHSLQIEQKETYASFEYFSQQVEKFPFASFAKREVITDALPHFALACSGYHSSFKRDYIEKADQLILTLTVSGLVQLAELLLDIGRNDNEISEICFENPLYGFGGVNEKSIDVRFWLPNSFGFYTEKIEALKF